MSIRRFFRRRYWDEERAREIEAHLAQEIDDHVARGMSRDEARRAAHRAFGNPTLVREEIYAMNSVGWIETFWQDLRYGVRLLRRNPGFATVAILTLALGTGANTAMFEVMNAVWLRPLPVPHAEELVQVQVDPNKGGRWGERTGRFSVLSVPEWEQLRDRQRVFASIAAWGTATFDIARGGPVQPVEGLWVSGSFFETIGIHALRGRTIAPADDRAGCASAGVVISHGFWQRQFGGDPGTIGRTLSLNGHVLEIIGITPATFTGIEVGRSFDVAAPLCAEPLLDRAPDPHQRPTFWFIDAIGRLAPGVSVAQASAALAALSPSLYRTTLPAIYDAETRKDYLDLTLMAVPASTGVSTLRDTYQRPVGILLAATGLVLLIACANLANLLLARGAARTREVSVRLAIGASRLRVVRQLVSESAVIAFAGAAAGFLISRWSVVGLVALIGRSNRGLWLDVTPDGRVLAFTLGIAVLACAIFGVVPAIRGTALNPGVALKAGGRGTTESAAGFNLRSALVVIQVALSLVLTAAALLFVRTLHNLAGEALGFAPDRMLVAALDFSPARLPLGPEDLFHDRLLARIRALPGVQDAAEVSILPIDGSGWNERILVDGRQAPTLPMFNSVTPGYFRAMHTPFISGRDFRASDATAPRAAIVNQAFVTRFLAGGNALGRTFEVVKPVGTARPRYVVIGVVADAKYRNLREPFPPTAYLDMAQMPAEDLEPHLIVRTSRPFLATSEAVTRAVAEINPDITVRYRTMDGVIDEALSRERVMAILSAVFGALATVIAIIGLYGVISYAVARRRMEIGIRLALGAERGSVVRLIIYQAGVLLIVPGLAIGGFLAVLAGRAAASLLYGVHPGDPLTMTAAIGSLGAVAFVSCAIPAWRASRVSPIATLHED